MLVVVERSSVGFFGLPAAAAGEAALDVDDAAPTGVAGRVAVAAAGDAAALARAPAVATGARAEAPAGAALFLFAVLLFELLEQAAR
ncbi:MAG TPA: hypothetical protein VFD32_03795, partial [Dehalococcoidia bacterium]|nr:hypothetical protein [Dehalococcoidia bacterium]